MPIHGKIWVVLLKQVRRPLVGLAAHESVEILKSHADRPLVERPGRAVQIGRRVVVLAEPRGGIAVVPEDGPDRCALRADDGIVAGIAGGHFADHAKADRMVVAAGDQRRPRRRAKRGRVELGVAQTRLGDAIHVRGRDDAAEGAGHAIALVVGHDQQHVRRALGRHDATAASTAWNPWQSSLITPPNFGGSAEAACHRLSSWRWANPACP